MENNAIWFYIVAILAGYLCGGLLFCRFLPQWLTGTDICSLFHDHNPGTANVFSYYGVPLGVLCLIAELSKGAVPLYLSCQYLDLRHPLFAIVLLAPVLGHAFSPFYRFSGGKCIAVSFGVLLGLLPRLPILWLLVFLYLFFSLIIRINPHNRRSILTFFLFGLFSCILLWIHDFPAVAVGCLLLSAVVILKHRLAE